MLNVQGLKKYFGGVKAVDGCSFFVEEGKITALIGPNGAGKSTVFNLVVGLIEPEGGIIRFNRQNIILMEPHLIAQKGISRVFQKSKLFRNLTVRENLELAISDKNILFWKSFFGKNKLIVKEVKRIEDILKLFKIHHMENKFCRELSFGQARLVELARAILKPHKILLLDEPVAGVTPSVRREIITILKKLKKAGETILLIEHDMFFTFDVSDKVVVMDEGKVIAEGSPSDVKKNKMVLEAYLGE